MSTWAEPAVLTASGNAIEGLGSGIDHEEAGWAVGAVVRVFFGVAAAGESFGEG